VRVALLALNFAEYASRLAVALSAKHEVLLLLRTSNAERELTGKLRALLDKSANVQCLEPRRWRDPRVLGTSFAINRILRRFAPDILHVQEIHPVLGGGTILSFRRSIPVVYTVHDPVNHSGQALPQNGLRWKILMWFRRRTSRLIVHGPQMRLALEGLDRRIAERIDVIPHGLLGQPSIDDDHSRSEPATFLFFGRIEPYKGLGYFLRAGEILQSRGHALKLVVAGTGTDLERHRGRIAESACVELIDRYVLATEVGGLFRRATAVVLPYTDATQSGVAAMAVANSRPVIATAVGDVPDVVIHGRTGLLVPPCDAGALADAMEQLIVDRHLRDSLAAGAGQYANEALSWSRIAELTEGTYRRAIEACRLRGTARFSVADESK
jgi:glycosyltransferase involved in cell wall biosynthesis